MKNKLENHVGWKKIEAKIFAQFLRHPDATMCSLRLWICQNMLIKQQFDKEDHSYKSSKNLPQKIDVWGSSKEQIKHFTVLKFVLFEELFILQASTYTILAMQNLQEKFDWCCILI